jgi:hypothetical protein
MDSTAMIVLDVRDSASIATISTIDVPTAATMDPIQAELQNQGDDGWH